LERSKRRWPVFGRRSMMRRNFVARKASNGYE
jgi:hypothetical protein